MALFGLRGLAVAAAMLAALAAAGVAASATRFEVTPSDTGVTRIDTQTGAVSHCTPSDGIWFCDRVVPGNAGAPATPSLDEPGRLSRVLAALAGQVDGVASRIRQGAPPKAADVVSAPATPSVASAVVARLAEMVRRLKDRGAG